MTLRDLPPVRALAEERARDVHDGAHPAARRPRPGGDRGARVTPVRAPAIVRGDVPGLLRRGMPTVDPHGNDGVYEWCQDNPPGSYWTIDYTDPAALYLSLHWLADRGHLCGWMLPATHGGRVEAWDGLTAWEVSAILVSVSVGRVAAGKPPIRALYDNVSQHPRAMGFVLRRLVGGHGESEMAPYASDAEARWSAALASGCCLQVPGGLVVPV